MKKIMILGASAGQIPLIKKAKELGYYVGVVDYDLNADGISLADEFFNISTIDEEAILEAAKTFKPDGIATMQTDMPMRAIGKVNEELGLCGIDRKTAIIATDKIKMIQCFKEKQVESPWFLIIDNDLKEKVDLLKYPCIFKPADNSGSRGVFLVKSPLEVKKAYEYSKNFSREGKVLVEEYMQGPEVSVEVLVWNGSVSVIAVTDKMTTGAPFFVEMGHKEPSDLGKINIEKISDLAKKAVNAVGIKNGEAHVEIILTKEGPKVVELGARLGGDFITSYLVPLSTGVDMLTATLKIACGEEPDTTIKIQKGSAIRYISAEEGIIHSIEGIEEAEKLSGINRTLFFKKIGDKSKEIHNSLDRIGCVIAEGKDAKEANSRCEEAIKKMKVVIKSV